MINSCRTYSHNELKQMLKQAKKNIRNHKRPILESRVDKNIQNYKQPQNMLEIMRDHELRIMELRNEVIKKEIQLKERVQNTKDISRQNQLLKKQKQGFAKIKHKFENQRKMHIQKIRDLQQTIENLKQQLEQVKPPKDRYETCIRELDQLKISIDNKQDVSKQRDFYKFVFDEIRQLVISPFHSPTELQACLRSLFNQIDDKAENNK